MMKWQALMVILSVTFFTACSGDKSGNSGNKQSPENRPENKYYDGIGVGPIKEVTLGDVPDEALIKSGEQIYNSKCTSCHKLSAEKGIGPGLAGITERRRPEWIMNMMLNVDVMLDQDPEAQKMLEECLVRMPNQSLSKDDGRHVLEFMRTL